MVVTGPCHLAFIRKVTLPKTSPKTRGVPGPSVVQTPSSPQHLTHRRTTPRPVYLSDVDSRIKVLLSSVLPTQDKGSGRARGEPWRTTYVTKDIRLHLLPQIQTSGPWGPTPCGRFYVVVVVSRR